MDIELMHYLVNPEKGHKLELLARTYLGINLEECLPEQKEEGGLSLFDDVTEAEEAESARFPEAVATLMLGEKIGKELEELELKVLYDTMEA